MTANPSSSLLDLAEGALAGIERVVGFSLEQLSSGNGAIHYSDGKIARVRSEFLVGVLAY